MRDNPPMHPILLIDDDEQLAPPLREYLARFDLDLSNATEPEQGLARLNAEAPELVLLDVMLPGIDGFEVLRRIRRHSDVPVIMLTARGEVADRIVGIELGADDYLPKPFEPRELAVRIQGVLRRTIHRGGDRALLRFERLTIDQERHQVSVDDHPAELTDMEYRLLLLFLATAALAALIVGGGFRAGVSQHLRAQIEPHLLAYLDYLQRDLGSPPDPARAAALESRLPLAIRITGPDLDWTSHDAGDFDPRVRYHRRHGRYDVGHRDGQLYLRSRDGDYTLTDRVRARPERDLTALRVAVVIGVLLLLTGLYLTPR